MKEWSKKRLIEITEKIGSGATPRGGGDAYKESGISLFRSLNVHDGTFKEKNLAFIDEEQASKLSNVKVQEGDVLLNITGASIARCCVAPSELLPARVNQHVAIIRPKPNCIDTNFLAYLFVSKAYKDALLNTGEKAGATRQALTKTQLQDFEVIIPSLSEQKRIVTILDEVFEGIDRAIANTEKNLANARELFERYLNAIFTQKGDHLGDLKSQFVPLSTLLSEQPRNGWSPPSIFQTGEGIPVLTLSAVTGFNYDGSRIKLTSAPTKEKAHYWLKKGELLITRSNTPELVGHVAIYDGNPQQAICCDLIMKMTLDSTKADTRFIYYYLRSFAARRYLMSNATGASATMPKINKQVVQNTPIPVFSVAEQKNIVTKLDEISIETQRLETIYRQKLAALNELKQSILQKAFIGELTADTANQAIEAAEQDRPISQDCLRSPETVKQNVHPSGQLSLGA